MPNPNPKQSDKFKEAQQRMKDGEIQKLPRKANSADKTQVTIRIDKSTRKFIREYAKEKGLSQGDALDEIIKLFLETP